MKEELKSLVSEQEFENRDEAHKTNDSGICGPSGLRYTKTMMFFRPTLLEKILVDCKLGGRCQALKKPV